MIEHTDIAVVGAGAAGLFAGIFAGRTLAAGGDARPGRVVALDGAKVLGAKILVAGGGRCNVTHYKVDEQQYAGASRNAIKKVLRRFDVADTRAFFHEMGVELKREDTGKLFPVTDNARTVLNALLAAAEQAGVAIYHPDRVTGIDRVEGGFEVRSEQRVIRARRVVLATGGMALPRTGSDGAGYAFAKAMGHTLTDPIFPSLVPLTLPKDHFLCGLSGIAAPATLEVRAATGKRLHSFTNPVLCTHFGISGPCVLDVSRYYTDAKAQDPGAQLVLNWLPGKTAEEVDVHLQGLGKVTPARALMDVLPERLVRALCEHVGVEVGTPGAVLTRDKRRALARAVAELPLPITGDRGFTFAEVTAGGVPLSEIHLETMESRVCTGLHLCGEILDVDGRVGGFNFQWAWASGFVAGAAAAKAADAETKNPA